MKRTLISVSSRIMAGLSIILASATGVFSQEPVLNIPDYELEQIMKDAEIPPDLTDLIQEAEDLVRHPVNLNRATEEDLQKIHCLTARQVNAILAYLLQTGVMYSLHELNAIEALDSLTLVRLRPYVTAGPPEEKRPLTPRKIFREGRSSFMLRFNQLLQQQKGYKSPGTTGDNEKGPAYPGSPQGYYFRYQFNYAGRIQWGISGKKDPGEQFFRGNQPYGMDIYSGYINLKNCGPLKDLLVGNYQAGFGQCLTLGTGQMMNTSFASSQVIRSGSGFRPSLSTGGSGTLKGIAATFRISRFDLSAFYSLRKRDATVGERDPGTQRILSVTTFQETGYHRSQTEIEKRNSVTEHIIGGNVRFRNRFISVGATAFRSQWNARIQPKEQPYNRYDFRGDRNFNAGADFRVRFSDHSCFGEFSLSGNGGKAWMLGLQADPDDDVSFSVIVRDYQRNYQNFLSHGFGRNSRSSNEQGIYLSLRVRATDKLGFSGYVDACRFPWLKYTADFPSSVTEWGIISELRSSSLLTFSVQLRYRISVVNTATGVDVMHRPSGKHHLSTRLKADLQVSPALQILSRADWIYNRGKEAGSRNGILFLQDIRWKLSGKLPGVSFRYALFDSDSYEERICTYEQDVLYGFSAPSLDGRGIRCYLMASWTPFRQITFWGKLGNTWYADRLTLGSGEDLINGNQRTEIRLQVQFKW